MMHAERDPRGHVNCNVITFINYRLIITRGDGIGKCIELCGIFNQSATWFHFISIPLSLSIILYGYVCYKYKGVLQWLLKPVILVMLPRNLMNH